MVSITLKERVIGSMLGLAIGDALGAPIEFERPGNFEPITRYRSGGPFLLESGTWTDDTSLALCLAQSLIDCKGFDPIDQLVKYCKWWEEGYMSATGNCFDIGNTTSAALREFKQTGQPYPLITTNDGFAGNGSLMRLAPIPLFYHGDLSNVVKYSRLSSATTHGSNLCIDACALLGVVISTILSDIPKEQIFEPGMRVGNASLITNQEIIKVLHTFDQKEPPTIVADGYATRSLEAALWAFNKGQTFRQCVLYAVNLGNDSDTVGAITGALAGAYYGASGIPAGLIRGLKEMHLIFEVAENLYNTIESLK